MSKRRKLGGTSALASKVSAIDQSVTLEECSFRIKLVLLPPLVKGPPVVEGVKGDCTQPKH